MSRSDEYRRISDEIDALTEHIARLQKERKALGMPSQRIEALELTVRASNVLKTERVRTVADLTRLSRRYLLGLPHCGTSTVRDIEEELQRYGLTLADGSLDSPQ
jgi:DNA-directed RNA polymerase alpha subunit